MADAHELIVKLKELAIELGRTPTRDEFQKVLRSRKAVSEAFGSYATLVQAAGLEPTRSNPRRITNDIFKRDIERHLEEYAPSQKPDKEPYPRILLGSDIHFPFHDKAVVQGFLEFAKKNQPDHIVLNGDIRDFYSHAKFPRSHNEFTPREENQLGRKLNEQLWKDLQAACPKAKCYQMTGNHSARPMKRILEEYPEAEDWLREAMQREFTFEGVKTFFDPREELVIGNVMIHHGYKSQLGDHMKFVLKNICTGHTHRGGVVFRNLHGSIIWELNSGYMGDPYSKGLSYTSQKATDWTQGWAFVDEYGPRFIPFR